MQRVWTSVDGVCEVGNWLGQDLLLHEPLFELQPLNIKYTSGQASPVYEAAGTGKEK